MIRIELANPRIPQRIANITKRGYGRVADWELLQRLVEVAKHESLEIEFVRLEGGGEVVFDLEHMEAALEAGREVRPVGK